MQYYTSTTNATSTTSELTRYESKIKNWISDYILFSHNKTALEFEIEIKETIQNSINYDMQILNVIKT